MTCICSKCGGTKFITPRERDLLQGLTEGLTNRLIAERYHITEGTVKVYMSRIYEKLGVETRLQAALHWKKQREGANNVRAN